MKKTALSIQNVSKTYTGGTCALSSVNLEVPTGSFFGLLGENGAGKTTMIGIITDLVKKSSGKVHVFGLDLDTQILEVKKRVAVVPQEFNFNVFEKVEDILIYQAGYYGIPKKKIRKRINTLLKDLDLYSKRRMPAGTLSGGMKRRLMIARALVLDPDLLILDEPTVGVDVFLRQQTWEYLRERNKAGLTVLLTTHYLEEAEYLCDHIAVIKEGSVILSETKEGLLKKAKNESYVLEFSVKPRSVVGYTCVVKKNSLTVQLKHDQSLGEFLGKIPAKKQLISVQPAKNKLEQAYLDVLAKK